MNDGDAPTRGAKQSIVVEPGATSNRGEGIFGAFMFLDRESDEDLLSILAALQRRLNYGFIETIGIEQTLYCVNRVLQICFLKRCAKNQPRGADDLPFVGRAGYFSGRRHAADKPGVRRAETNENTLPGRFGFDHNVFETPRGKKTVYCPGDVFRFKRVTQSQDLCML